MNVELARVYLVRHGETAWMLTGLHAGRTDLPLTEEGGRQARELGSNLTALSFDRIFSSPPQRARRTAELAMPHARLEEDNDLMEWDYGAYEGKRTADIEVERLGWRVLHDSSPGGETLDAVGARSDRVTGRLCAQGGNVPFFAHRELLRILAARWIVLAPVEGRRLQLTTVSLSVLGYDHDLTESVMHVWNARVTAAAGAQ